MENEEADNKRKEEVDKLNQVDSVIFQTEKQISEFEDKLTEDDKSDLDSKLNDLKTIYENRDFESMDESLETLNKTWARNFYQIIRRNSN